MTSISELSFMDVWNGVRNGATDGAIVGTTVGAIGGGVPGAGTGAVYGTISGGIAGGMNVIAGTDEFYDGISYGMPGSGIVQSTTPYNNMLEVGIALLEGHFRFD